MEILLNRCVFLNIAFIGSVFTWVWSICYVGQVDLIAQIYGPV